MPEKASGSSEMIVSTFKLANWKIDLAVPKDQIRRESVGMLTAVVFRPEKPISISGMDWPIIVFAARLNAELKFEQSAEGFPCRSDSEAEGISQVIQANNQKVPFVGLASWPGHFTLAAVSNADFVREELVLYRFHEPKMIENRRCGYALRMYRNFVVKPRELAWEELLHTTNARSAQKALAKKQAELAGAIRIQRLNSRAAISDADLTAIKFKVLSKAYPQTVAYLSDPSSRNADAAFAVYKQETLAATGRLLDTLAKDEFKAVAKLLEKASRRKNPALNPIEFQLVAGWRLHSYDKMTPEQRFHMLRELGFKPSSPDAVRKMCERLKLPSQRRPGAPKKEFSGK
ncbi:MAG TPA: hypothetical protein VFC07_03985 [Verrucomicrobiae bacterium]|nr:hypothetical protein [Verrucomicrobiae bacterium]